MIQGRWTVQVVSDPDDPDELLLDLGIELCQQLGWKAGDTIIWHEQEDGTWLLTPQSTTSTG